MKSRRTFLKLVALTSASALAPALPKPARGATPRSTAAPKARSAAVEAEIKKQIAATAQALKTIRDFELRPGSEMAFVFAPQRVTRRRASTKGGSR
jgi:hypothetical protein